MGIGWIGMGQINPPEGRRPGILFSPGRSAKHGGLGYHDHTENEVRRTGTLHWGVGPTDLN